MGGGKGGEGGSSTPKWNSLQVYPKMGLVTQNGISPPPSAAPQNGVIPYYQPLPQTHPNLLPVSSVPPPPNSSGTPPVPPTSATSATQELDKLMASLSDFHLRRTVSPKDFRMRPPPHFILHPHNSLFPSSHPQPPQKKGVPEEGNLDSMLVLLQSDLSRQGVPTGAKGVCGSCQKPIAGKVGFGVLLGEGGRKKRCLVYPKVGVPCWSLKMRGWGGGGPLAYPK